MSNEFVARSSGVLPSPRAPTARPHLNNLLRPPITAIIPLRRGPRTARSVLYCGSPLPLLRAGPRPSKSPHRPWGLEFEGFLNSAGWILNFSPQRHARFACNPLTASRFPLPPRPKNIFTWDLQCPISCAALSSQHGIAHDCGTPRRKPQAVGPGRLGAKSGSERKNTERHRKGQF